MIEFSFQIDPHLVLGIPPGATLQEIRDAYRQQAKKYHPDTGGADWAFRVLAQAYEVLSRERVEQASRNEASRHPAPPRPEPRSYESHNGASRNGGTDPRRQVCVEKLWVRYESEPLWLMQEQAGDEHSLSCSLNFKWPDPTNTSESAGADETERILNQLTEVYEAMCNKTRVVTSRIRADQVSFTGWLSYPSVERATAAYKLLHGLLGAHGFGVRPYNRDLLIPRTWR